MANVPISAFTVPANTVGIGATGYSLTGSASASFMDLAGTWNTSGTPTAIKLNITETGAGSNAASLLMDLQVGGVSRVRVDKTGAIVNTLNTYGTSNFTLRGGASQNFGINLQSITAYFQTNSAVGVGITVSGSAGNVGVSNNGSFGFHTTVPGADALDTILTRRGAANLRLGAADAAAPVAQTLSVKSVVAGTTNTAGTNLTITGSQGTGTGAGGSLIFQVAPAGSSGTAQNALATALTIGSDRNSTFGGNITVAGGAIARILSSGSGGTAFNILTNHIGLSAIFEGGNSTFSFGIGSSNNTINGAVVELAGYFGFYDFANTSPNIRLYREAAGVLGVRGTSTTVGGALGFIEQTAPAAPATNGVRIYAEDNGSGKTRLMAIFATGAAQQIAIEP
jgi:hypothetical protein